MVSSVASGGRQNTSSTSVAYTDTAIAATTRAAHLAATSALWR